MSLVVRDDGDRIGHAILELGIPHPAPLSVALRFPDKTYLGPDGHRDRGRHLFVADPLDESGLRFRLGPEVTAHVRESEIVAIADADGRALGTVGWDGIRAPPATGRGGLRLSGDARQAGQRTTGAPIVAHAEPVVATPTPPSPPAADNSALSRAGADNEAAPMSPPARSRVWVPISAVFIGIAALAYVLAILAGFIGWRLEPHEIAFEGAPGGPFRPASTAVVFRRTGVAALLAPLFGEASPIAVRDIPTWLDLRATRDGDGWRFNLLVKVEETAALPPGRTDVQVPLTFPLRAAAGFAVALTVVPPPTPTPVPHQPVASIDDALCDKLAGNRFDPDHPAGVPAQDEIFELAIEQSTAGLTACDPREDRSGADRRFLVQRGRLLAERALRRLAAGDISAATADMDAAVAAWRRGDAAGSAYAANLLGAYYSGTFNRPAHAFVTPDDATAVAHWREGMQRGSLVAQTNFAAELLSGQGIAADPTHALALLRTSLAKGEPRAGGVLGVALYTGAPQGVPLDKAAGWPLVVAAQCLDRNARALVEEEVKRGAKPAAERHACAP